MFPRRLSEVSGDEVRALIDLEVTESDDVEFKQELPFDASKGPDPWANGAKISDHAKDILGSEIIAFANAGGGTLIVGIEEERATKKAQKITPVPDCKKLAERLHQSLTNRVEPKLPVFECEGVVTEADATSGVVIMRTLPSYLMPHRMTSDNHCYIRRNDRSEPMSMLEIQEAARRAGRSAEEMDLAFSQSSERFYSIIPPGYHRSHPFRGLQTQLVRHEHGIQYTGVWGLRFTARPFAPLPIGNLPREPWLSAIQPESFDGPGRQGPLVADEAIISVRTWVPRLRSVEREIIGRGFKITDRISTDGQIERFVLCETRKAERQFSIAMNELIWNLASSLRMVATLRAECSRPMMMFALEIEFMTSEPLRVLSYPGLAPLGMQTIPAETILFPRYEIAEQETFNALLTSFDSDVWNVAGYHPDWELGINGPPAKAILPSNR